MIDEELFNLDLAERRVLQHESECRGAATYLCNPASPHVVAACKRKRCRRRQLCMGPMLACEHSIEPAFLVQEDGFDIEDIAFVPACIANRGLPLRLRFEALRGRFCKALLEEINYEWPEVASTMKALGWNKAPASNGRPEKL